ncbi:hypothetical protein H7F50_16230 [Novosphingobium flavum]|uniref:hypothetical protein n=1 Tax=Novosphingobium aerophilum TaxID=2839843 RepID=UPI00163A9063|nr:hypothetical protein [Novosphingobium aerophilum]MBC2663297.1 hypothetical protein [Novosphingobium aerophilum]
MADTMIPLKTLARRYAPRAARNGPILAGLVLASLVLDGCAQRGTYPSLARRPQEIDGGRIAGTLPAPADTTPADTTPADTTPADTTPAAPASPVATTSLAELRSRAEGSHQRFAAQRAKDGPAIASGRKAGEGSEAWALGSAALADLIAEHDATVAVLAEIDSLYAAERIDGGDGGAIAAVRDQVTAWVADEDAVLAELVGP